MITHIIMAVLKSSSLPKDSPHLLWEGLLMLHIEVLFQIRKNKVNQAHILTENLTIKTITARFNSQDKALVLLQTTWALQQGKDPRHQSGTMFLEDRFIIIEVNLLHHLQVLQTIVLFIKVDKTNWRTTLVSTLSQTS